MMCIVSLTTYPQVYLMNNPLPLFGVTLLLACSLPGAIVEDFTSYHPGESLSLPLAGGSGWAAAWSTANTGTHSGTIANTSPMNGGGNYLDVSLGRTSNGGITSLWRDTGASSLSMRQGVHTYTFDWRADSLANFSDGNDRFEFFNGHNTGTSGNDTSGLVSANNGDGDVNNTSAWSSILMGVFGTSRGANSTATAFTVYDPDVAAIGEPFDGADYFDIGKGGSSNSNNNLIVTAGTTYSISIVVHPALKLWDVSVTDGTTTAFTNGIKFWGNPDASGQYLVFATRGNSSGEAREFSIDNVTLVPEPAEVVWGLGLVIAGLVVLRRRHPVP